MKTIEVYEREGSIWSTNGILIGPLNSVEVYDRPPTDIVKQAIDLKEAGFTSEEVFSLLRRIKNES